MGTLAWAPLPRRPDWCLRFKAVTGGDEARQPP